MRHKIILTALLISVFINISAFKRLESKTYMENKGKIIGIGGVFFKSEDHKSLKKWYAENMGMDIDEYGTHFKWKNEEHPNLHGITQWSPFEESMAFSYFKPSEKPYMINYIVDDMEAIVKKLKKNGVKILDEVREYDNGKFVHTIDPEGNKIELWEPKEIQ